MDLTITGKTRTTPATAAVLYGGIGGSTGLPQYVDRYKWLSLDLAEPNLGIPLSGVDLGSLQTGSFKFSSTQTFLLCSNVRGERGWVAFNAAEQQFNSEERQDLTNVDMSLEWLLYRDPIIYNFQLSAAYFNTGFKLYPGIAEGKDTIDILLEAGLPAGGTGAISLSWVTNKVDERAIRTYFLKSPNGRVNDSLTNTFTGDYKFRTFHLPSVDTTTLGTSVFYLTAQDWRKDKATGILRIRSLGPIFYGTTLLGVNQILGATIKAGSKIVTGFPRTFYDFGVVNDNYLWVAWPMDLNYKPLNFQLKDTSFVNQATNADFSDDVDVTLDSLAVIKYRVFRTRNRYNTNPGTTTGITLL